MASTEEMTRGTPYLEDLASDATRRLKVEEALKAGDSFVEDAFGVVMLLELAVGISERHYGLQKVIFNIARWYGIRVVSSITPCQAILSSSISGAFSKPISLTQAFLRCFFDIKDQLYDYYGKDSVIIKGAMISTVLWNIIVGNFDTGLHYAVDSRYFHTLPGLIVGADRGEIFIDTRTWDIFMSGFADDNESTMVRQSGGGVFLGSRPESIAWQGHASGTIPGMVDDFKEDFLISPPPCSFLNSFGSTFDKDRIPIEHYGNSNSTDGFVIVTALSGSFDGSTVQNIVASLKQYLHHFTVAYRLEVEDDFQCLLACIKEKGEKASTSVISAVLQFREAFDKEGIFISIAKGEFEVVNVDFAGSPSMRGDTVAKALGMSAIQADSGIVLCDSATKSVCHGYRTKFIGRYRFRRKPKVMEVWGIEGSVTNPNFPVTTAITPNFSMVVGYGAEKMQISDALDEWINDGCVRVAVVQGPSGIGKTTIMDFFSKTLRERKIDSCITRIAKEEQLTPFTSITYMIRHIFKSFIRAFVKKARTQKGYSPFTSPTPVAAINREVTLRASTLKHEKDEGFLPETIGICLARMNEDPSLAPLLADFFPEVEFEQTDFTRNLALPYRINILTLLIPRLVGELSRLKKTALIFDDVQWMDSVSFKVLNLIISSKPKGLFVFICTRPNEIDYNSAVASIPSKDFVYLKLKGLQPDDVRAFLKMAFPDAGIRVVDPDVISLLLATTSNPLALGFAVETLKKNLAFCINDDVLQFDRVKAARISELLEGTIGDAILTQFERLHPDFQLVLRYACISGQYFELENVARMMDRPNAVEKLRNIVRKEDTFAFLKLENDAEGKPQVYFRHISITVAIYESIPIAERSSLHSRLGYVLESYLDDSNRYTILPLLYHHFSIGEDMVKRIIYTEELGIYYESRGFRREAITVMTELTDLAESLSMIPAELDTPERRALWYSTLTSAATSAFDMDIVLKSGLKSLRLVGVDIPDPDKVTSGRLFKLAIRQLRLFLTTRGGRRPLSSLRKHNMQAYRICNQSISSMFMVTLPSEAIPKTFKLHLTLELINLNIEVGYAEPSQWAVSAFLASYILLYGPRWLCKLYFKAGQAAAGKCSSGEIATSFIMHGAVMTIAFRDRKTDIEKYSQDFQRYFAIIGDTAQWQSARNFMFYLHHPKSMEEAKELLTLKLDEILDHNAFSAFFTLSLYMRYLVTYGEITETEECLIKLGKVRERTIGNVQKCSKDLYIPEISGRLWLAIIHKDLVKSVSEFDSFCNHLVSPFSVNFISNVAGFSLQALWPIMSMADTLGDHDLISCRQRILSHIKVARPVFVALKKLNPWTSHVLNLLDGSYCLFKGDRRTARRHLRTLITPKSVAFWEEDDPGWLGVANMGLWMLDGDEKYRIEARGYFERIQANTFLTWMHGAKVLSSRW